ncbi:MAG TPA: hypothetical protein VKJ67_19475 [Methylomirabilota bacterium]|nr:hypothetical protein [Methylomirabilota bacterium]
MPDRSPQPTLDLGRRGFSIVPGPEAGVTGMYRMYDPDEFEANVA